MPVFVIDKEGTPLLPTCEARARILLRKDRAEVYSVEPFTIQLKYKVDKPVGEFKVGIDDGAKEVGIAVAHEEKVVFAGTIRLRQDVPRKMLQRAQYRCARRSRNLRHRPQRFLNRGKKGRLPPTIRQKKDSILRVLDDLMKRIRITACTVEHGQFDVSSMAAGYKLTGKEYQKAEYEGNNWRQKILWRDKYTCQRCKSKEWLQAHHIKPKSQGGTNALANGITLCKECHEALHASKWVLKKKVKHFKYPAHVQQGKWYLVNALKERFQTVRICFGWMTANARKVLGLGKSHTNDAAAMVGAYEFICKLRLIIPRRTKVWENNPTKICIEKNGFRHWDIVSALHRTKGIVIGSVRSLKANYLTLRTYFDKNFPVAYSKTKVIWHPRGLVYCYSNEEVLVG